MQARLSVGAVTRGPVAVSFLFKTVTFKLVLSSAFLINSLTNTIIFVSNGIRTRWRRWAWFRSWWWWGRVRLIVAVMTDRLKLLNQNDTNRPALFVPVVLVMVSIGLVEG